MYMNRFRESSGLTLVEMLVALAIFGTVMAGVSVVFISSMRAWQTAQDNRSVFEMGRAALQFMQRDITSVFGSVDRGEMQTFVGTSEWLTFAGIMENPLTGWSEAHSDMSRVSYYLMHDPTGREDMLLIRLVSIDEQDVSSPLPDLVPDRRAVVDPEERVYFRSLLLAGHFADLAGGEPVEEADFELASNILNLTFHYGTVTAEGGIKWADTEWNIEDGIDNDRDGLIDEAGDGIDNVGESRDGLDNDGDGKIDEFGEGVDEYNEGWNASFVGELPEIIEVHIAVRAEAPVPAEETKERVFRATILLPLGYRRPLPAVLQQAASGP